MHNSLQAITYQSDGVADGASSAKAPLAVSQSPVTLAGCRQSRPADDWPQADGCQLSAPWDVRCLMLRRLRETWWPAATRVRPEPQASPATAPYVQPVGEPLDMKALFERLKVGSLTEAQVRAPAGFLLAASLRAHTC